MNEDLNEFYEYLSDNSCLDSESIADIWYKIMDEVKLLRALQALDIDGWNDYEAAALGEY